VAVRVEADTRVDRWAQQARARVAEFETEVDPAIAVELAFDQSRYTEQRLANLGGNLLAGAAVVMLVVLVGMGWRSALIVGAALPLSAAFALFGIAVAGQQIHQMSIFGMIIAVGLLIDNAIVMTDEVRKRLRSGLVPADAVAAAVGHLFSPLLASTLTTILGFMPVFLLPGNVGDFVGPIAISVVLALIGSFLISMTVIPALAALFARPRRGAAGGWWRDGIAPRRAGSWARATLLAGLRHPWRSLGLALGLSAAGFVSASTLGTQFFPAADRDQFEVELRLGEDSSMRRSRAVMADVEQAIRAVPGVTRVDWLVGGSYPSVYYNLVMDQDNDPSYAHAIVQAESPQTAKAVIPMLQRELDAAFPQAQIVVSAFGQGPPYEAPVAFRLVGPRLEVLRELGQELRRVMHLQPAILHTRATVSGGEPKLWFEAEEDEARLAGLTLSDVAAQFQGNLEGRVGGSVLEDLEDLPVRIRYSNDERGSLDRIGALNLVADNGGWLPAEALGSLDLRPETGTITRRNGERVNKVLGYVAPGTLAIDVTRAIQADLAEQGFRLPAGYRLEVAGDSEEQGRAIALLLTYLPVLMLLMIATVVLSFRSVVLAGIIGAVALMSVGLSMLSLWMAGYPLGFNPIIGSAGLVGVAINGTIVVLAAIRANPRARAGDAEAIVDETLGATRHILSTTLTTMGGFLPLLLFTGGDFWPPLAIVIAGGVGFSVILSLGFTPAVYRLIYGRRRPAPVAAAQPA
jgi:multidrug efflux pump subunit AcrB